MEISVNHIQVSFKPIFLKKMKHLKKYVTKGSDNHFSASLKNSKTKVTIVSRDDFPSYNAAMQFLNDEYEKIHPNMQRWSFQKLARFVTDNPSDNAAKYAIKDKIEDLRNEMLFVKICKEGISEKEAYEQVNTVMGENYSHHNL